MGTNLTGRGNKEDRANFDFYPTPFDVTWALMQFLDLPKSTIWEPCCGTGEISKVLEAFGHKVISSDIRETGYGNGGIDFLSNEIDRSICFDSIITNPPFDISHSIIKKALSFDVTICMLLKAQYWHAKKRLSLFRENSPSHILPLTWRPNFNLNPRGSAVMDVFWTVWTPGVKECKYAPLDRPTKHKFFL